jgi:hypothetical protein
VKCKYILNGNRLQFQLGNYDANYGLIIDPEIAFSEGKVTRVSDGSDLALSSKWVAFKINKNRFDRPSVQLSEFSFFQGASIVPMAGVQVTNPGFDNGNPNEAPASAADSNDNT